MKRVLLAGALAILPVQTLKADIVPGGSGSPAAFPSGLTIAGGATMPAYDEGTCTPSQTGLTNATGSAVFGPCKFVRVGSKVTITIESISGITATVGSNVAATADKTQLSFSIAGVPSISGNRLYGGCGVESPGNFMLAVSEVGTGASLLEWDAGGSGAITLKSCMMTYFTF